MKLRLLVLALTCCLAVLVAGSAAAQAPEFNGCGVLKKDSDSDAANDPVADESGYPEEVEIESAWIQYDEAKGADATTINLAIKNLTGSVPPPATSITYSATYGGVTDATNFVRAHVDFAGMTAFEYGHLEDLAVSTRYAFDGPTRGELFLGEHGVAQIVVPAEAGGSNGTNLRGITALTQLGRTTVVPSAIPQSPSRGLSFQVDDVGIGSFTVGPCAPASEPPAGPAPPAGGPTPPSSSEEPLPVRLRSKSVKRAKARRTVKVKISSSEPLTDVGARVSKGRRAYGSGRIAQLDGKGTLKIKLTRTLKKGRYTLDLVGTDAQNRRRLAAFRLKVR